VKSGFALPRASPLLSSKEMLSRPPDLPTSRSLCKNLEPYGLATATPRELLRFRPRFGSPTIRDECRASRENGVPEVAQSGQNEDGRRPTGDDQEQQQ
jgi:hypothetical protein